MRMYVTATCLNIVTSQTAPDWKCPINFIWARRGKWWNLSPARIELYSCSNHPLYEGFPLRLINSNFKIIYSAALYAGLLWLFPKAQIGLLIHKAVSYKFHRLCHATPRVHGTSSTQHNIGAVIETQEIPNVITEPLPWIRNQAHRDICTSHFQ